MAIVVPTVDTVTLNGNQNKVNFEGVSEFCDTPSIIKRK